MSQILRSPYNTATGALFRYWNDADFSRYMNEFISPGVIMHTVTTALQVTEHAAGANMSVDVAAGKCLVQFTRNAVVQNGCAENTAVANLAIGNNASGLTRYDLVCMKIDVTLDANAAADNVASLVIVPGTPGAGVPATPADHLKLYEIEVIDGAVTIPNAKITDRRVNIDVTLGLLDDFNNHNHDGSNSLRLDLCSNILNRYYNINIERGNITANTVGAASALTHQPTYSQYKADAHVGDYCNSKSTVVWSTVDDLDYEHPIDIIICCQLLQNTAQDFYIGIAEFAPAAVVPADAISTTLHFGFFVQDGTLYASNASGAAQTKTDISAGITLINKHTLRIVRLPSSILFYVDNVLKATHTTNLPTANSQAIFIGITSQEVASKFFFLSSLNITSMHYGG